MKRNKLYQIEKLYFGHEELAGILGITPASARVTAVRYVRQGLLVRVKRNIYLLRDTWNNSSLDEKFQIANIGQVPSYISLMTALDFYGITTQLQRGIFESIALKRTKEINVGEIVSKPGGFKFAGFRYTRIAENLYFGFQKEKNYFIAKPEKALLDAFYLMSFGRYSLDLCALDAAKLDLDQMKTLSEPFPARTKRLLQAYGYLTTA